MNIKVTHQSTRSQEWSFSGDINAVGLTFKSETLVGKQQCVWKQTKSETINKQQQTENSAWNKNSAKVVGVTSCEGL